MHKETNAENLNDSFKVTQERKTHLRIKRKEVPLHGDPSLKVCFCLLPEGKYTFRVTVCPHDLVEENQSMLSDVFTSHHGGQ